MENKQIPLIKLPPAEESSNMAEVSSGKYPEKIRKPRFQRIDREQLSWQALNVDRLISEDHQARAIWEFVGKLDLSGYTKDVRAVEGLAGRPLLNPQLLISLWVYAYSQGVGSARAIERLCEHDPAYQWLTGMEVVNAHSLSDFRVEHESELKGLFIQILGLLNAEGMITLERLTQDGTKIRASAAPDSFRGKDRIEKALDVAREHVKAVDQLSEEETGKRVERARQRACRERKERLETALKQFDKTRSEGGVKDNKKPRVSMTDPEARIMKQPDGGFAPSYNVQVNTDAANGLIVAVGVTQAGNDLNQLTSGVDRVLQNLGMTPKQVVADGGYVSRDNILEMDSRNVDFIAPQCDEVGKAKSNYDARGISKEYESSQFIYDSAADIFQCPQGKTLHFKSKDESDSKVVSLYRADTADCHNCAAKGQCCPENKKSGRSVQRIEELPQIIKFRQKMETESAKEIYRTRSQIAETPNLWIKAKFKLRQFSVRGLKKVGMESIWVCLTYNICQWIRICWRKDNITVNAMV
jgi:transposase